MNFEGGTSVEECNVILDGCGSSEVMQCEAF
jgi:hypothetical protein